MHTKVVIKCLPKKSMAVAVDGNGCAGPTGSTNGPTEKAVSLKDIDNVAGVDGCRCSDDKFIERPNLVGTSEISETSEVDGPATSILDPPELPSSFLTSSSSPSNSCTSVSAVPYKHFNYVCDNDMSC